jgi:hypothetical protein
MDVESSLNYFDAGPGPSAVYAYRTPDAGQAPPPTYSRHPVCFLDAREHGGDVSLDGSGFVLLPQQSAVDDLYDADAVRAHYYPEMEKLVGEATGAVRVVAFDHNVRCAPMAKRGEASAQMPVKAAHNDYSAISGPRRVRELLPDEADALLEQRFAVVNAWRPIRGPVESTPLAVCDARTIGDDDLHSIDLIYSDRVGEVQLLAHNPAHRWYYVPRMTRDEVLLIKCYDSAQDGPARFTAHSAFELPDTSDDAAPRESIEVRTLAFFGPTAGGGR